MSCECKEQEKRGYYRYYDSPEGCDIFKKMLVTSRYGAMAGLFLGTQDVLMYSRAIGFGPILRRYAFHTVPLVLMGATFAGVANTLLRLREKNDALNYFIGGAACGPILTYYLGSYHALVLGGLALGVIAMVKKDAIDSDYAFVPNVQYHMRRVRKPGDYTLVADPKDSIQHTCGEN